MNTSEERDRAQEPTGETPAEAGIPNIAQNTARPYSKKGLLTIALLVVSLIAVAGLSIVRLTAGLKSHDEDAARRSGDRPAAAATELHRLDLSPAAAASAPVPTATRIPALVPTAAEVAEPIGVRRSGQPGPAAAGAAPANPEDAPVLLVSSARNSTSAGPASAREVGRNQTSTGNDVNSGPGSALDETQRNLEGYQRQLQGLLDNLTRSTAAASGQGSNATGQYPGSLAGGPGQAPSSGGLFGGQLTGSSTPRVAAGLLDHRSLTLPKGTAFTCALKTKVVSATSGLVGCQVQRNVYGDDGRVLLIERGSHLDGEYRIASVRPGMVRIPVLWTRIRTPNGVVVDVDSPGTGPLGESGIDGYVDNRWSERIGAAMLLSLIDDSVRLVIQNQTNETSANTVVLPSTTANTSKLAEKVLDSTINIPPLIYQNQGGIVGIYVARDVDFSPVYELKAVAR